MVYFTAELYIRYMSYESTREAFKAGLANCTRCHDLQGFAGKDPWFWFDLLLVIIMVVETWLIPIVDMIIEGVDGSGSGMGRNANALRTVRVLRVLRTARIVRVARYMPELMILIKGLMVAARSVFFTLVLLLLITYVFSIAFTQLGQGTPLGLEDGDFSSVPVTVLNLVIVSVMPDQQGFYEKVRDEGLGCQSSVIV